MSDNVETIPLNLEGEIKEYLSKNKVKVCLLTPCYGSVCFVNYVICLMKTKELLEKYNIELKIEFCKGDSLVSRARNNLIAKAMSESTVTHILFIDNDITWDPVNVIKLIIADKPLVGGVYPLKKYNWEKLSKDKDFVKKTIDKKNNSMLKNVMDDDLLIQHSLLEYNINYVTNTIKINRNLTEVRHIATGFMMIKRAVIEKMFQAFPNTKYTDDVSFLEPNENEFAYALFDCAVEDGHYLSEDWLFCNRWKNLGGKIFIDVSINLTHTGIEDYNGSYLTTLI
tara:strand:+ start:589 stop:1437 length:849 start_codon:yes stop_codon:yes gene_type:complete